jgi:dihydroneopterin aldolase
LEDTLAPFEARPDGEQRRQPLDRITVRDDIRVVEIGAFGSERGVTQRLRFNVLLEVAPHEAAREDDVDLVLSYDTITDAIEAELAAERLNLLETLAERIAARCLIDPRAARAFVRIEKLDRGTGALGVEIVRARAAAARPAAGGAAPFVLYLSPGVLAGPGASGWLDACAALARPPVLCLGPDRPEAGAASEAALRVGLLAIERAAWALMDRDPRFEVIGTRTELDWATRRGRPTIWAPVKMVLDARARPAADASTPLALAGWLADELGAPLAVAGADAGAGADPSGAIPVANPARLPDLLPPS